MGNLNNVNGRFGRSQGAKLTAILLLAVPAALGEPLSIANFKLISEQRYSRTHSYLTYKADLVNGNAEHQSVTAVVSSKVPNISVVPGQKSLQFGPVPANATVTSKGTFTLLVDRTVNFSFSDLEWSFTSPVADAGPPQTAPLGAVVRLNGGSSSNPGGLGALRYEWDFVSKPPGSRATLQGASEVIASFAVDAPGTYLVALTVSNGVGSDSATTTINTANSPPVANAGPSRTVKAGSLVQLSGSRSSDVDGDPLTYSWLLIAIPSGSSAALAAADTVSPSFVADKTGTYIARLIVHDGTSASPASTVTITTENTPPIAHAGSGQTVKLGSLVQLNGAGSTDVDEDTLQYSWRLLRVPQGSAARLSDASVVNPTFTADRPGTYVAQLTVNDGKVNSAPATVSIDTEALQPPTARAGDNQTVSRGTTVVLDGSGSDPQGMPITMTWSLITKPPGSRATLSSPSVARPTFVADHPGTYVAQLLVSNGYQNSLPSTISVTTTNTPPVADAGQNRSVLTGVTVTLDGTGSRDADGDRLIYSWSFTTRPEGSTAVLSDPSAPSPSFLADLGGVYIAQLIVSDGFATSDPVTATIVAGPMVIQLTPNPLRLPLNSQAMMTVSLGSPAGLEGQTVKLAVLDPSVINIPDEVFIPEGATGANITVTPKALGETQIAASAPGFRSGIATVQVAVPSITVSLTADTVGISRSVEATITLSEPAPAGGTTVAMSSVPNGIVTVAPGTLTIPSGQTTAKVTVTGAAEGTAQVTATAAGYRSGAASINVGRLGAILLQSGVTVDSGKSVPIQVSLASPAPQGGVTISLASTDFTKATISPTQVSIPQGATAPSQAPQVTGVNPGTTTINATAPGFTGASQSVTITAIGIIQVPTNLSVQLSRSSQLSISLNVAPVADLTVTLRSSNTSRVTISPASVVIRAGQTAPAALPAVQGNTLGAATITAEASGYASGTTTVNVGASLSFQAQTVNVAVGAVQNATLNLSSPAPAGGLAVSLSSNSGAAQVPTSITIPQGAQSVLVAITGVSAGSAVITASSSAPNVTSATTNVVVSGFSGSVTVPTSMTVDLGQTIPLTITLSAPAPAGGVSFQIASVDATTVRVLPTSVSIAAGQTQPAQTPQVTGLKPGSSNLTVSSAGFPTATIPVSVRASISFVPNARTINGFRTENIVLSLSGPAPAGGLTINLVSTNAGVATVPATVAFAAGANSVNVPVTSLTIGSTTIRASGPGLSETTAAITVQNTADIILPSELSVSPGESVSLPVSLARASANSTFLTLTSENSSLATVTPTTILIGAGETQPAIAPRVNGIAPGQVRISATGSGLASASTLVTVGFGMRFSTDSIQISGTVTSNQFLVLTSAAPAGGLTVDLTSSQATVATVPSSVTFPASTTTVSVPITAVRPGTTVIRARAAGIPDAVLNVTVVAPGSIVLPTDTSIQINDVVSYNVSLSTPAPPGGVNVALSSSNPDLATIEPASVFVAQGATSPSIQPKITAINVGTVDINATAPGYTSASRPVKLTSQLLWVESAITINEGRSRQALLSLNTAAPWAGLDVNLVSTDPTVASVQRLVNFFPDGSDVTILSITINGLKAGTAQIKATGINMPEAVLNVTVSGPLAIVTTSLPDATIGVPYSGQVQAAGGILPYTWALTSGTLPQGLTLNTTTGQITGTPTTEVNAASLTFRVTDASSPIQTATRTLTLTAKRPVAASIAATGGTPQSTAINTAFASRLTATVRDDSNSPVPNVTVTFSAPAQTGPSGTFAGGVNTAVTNASGVATSAVFTANGNVGQYNVTAAVAGVGSAATFVLTNTTGSPASITATAGASQSTVVNTNFATRLAATVRDAAGNPVRDATVTFTVPSTGPRCVFEGGVGTATTDASGVATSAICRANEVAGAFVVTARVTGVTAPASFNLTNNPGPAAAIVATGGSGQSATINTEFAERLVATVRDASGNPIANAVVTFTAPPTTGPSGTFNGANTATTNASGVATSNVFRANERAGSYNVTASVGEVSTPATFALTNTAGSASAVVATSGGGQRAVVEAAFAARLVATVRDGGANPIQGVTVTFAAPSSGASGTFAGGLNTATTNSSGVATSAIFTANRVAGSYEVLATIPGGTGPARFQLTNDPGEAASIEVTSGSGQSTAIQTAFAAPLRATVKDAFGNLKNNVVVTFTAPAATGASGTFAGGVNTATTNNDGVATSAVFTANEKAGSYTVVARVAGVSAPANFALTNTAGAAASIGATSGGGQTANTNTAFAARLVATVRDAGGNPVSNVLVTFTPPSSGASGTFAGGVNTATTNSSGVATSAIFTANGTAGTYKVLAGAAGVSVAAEFELTNVSITPASIAVVSGTPQSVVVNGQYAAPLVVVVRDAASNPLSGITVTFQAPASGASVAFVGGSATAVTNASGQASVTVRANTVAGGFAVNARVTGVTNPATFQLTNNAGPAASITPKAGTPQTGTVNLPYQTALAAEVKDSFGNLKSGAIVNFIAPASGPGGTFAANGDSAQTNLAGVATAGTFTANAIQGEFKVLARTPGVATDAEFVLTNVVGPSGRIVVTDVTVGRGLQGQITVTIPTPAPPQGLTVTLRSSNPGRLLLSPRAVQGGSPEINITILAGLTDASGIYAHALDNTGTATITASAENMQDGTATVTMTPAGFILSGPNGDGVSSFAVSQGVSNTAITVKSARLDSNNRFVEIQAVRGGSTVTVNLANTTPSVGTVAPTVVPIANGDTQGVVTFSALQAGATTLTAEIPSGFSQPRYADTGLNANQLTANVTPSGLIVPETIVGRNLQAPQRVRLNGTAPAGGVVVTIASGDPNRVRLSTTPTGAGQASINVTVPEGQLSTPEFYVHGLESTGNVTISATGSGYGSADGRVVLRPSGFIIFETSILTTVRAPNTNLTIYAVMLNSSLQVEDFQPLRSGVTANVAVVSSNTSVGEITTSPLSFTGGAASRTTQFDPKAAGTTTISLTTPTGFNTPASSTSITAQVIQPAISVPSAMIGRNLQQIATILLGEPAPAGGVTVTVTSESSLLRVAKTPTAAGAASITVDIPAGQGFGQFYLYALEGSGTATYRASASGYESRSATVTMAPSGIVIAGPFGFGFPLVAREDGPNQPVTLFTAMLEPGTLEPVLTQPLAGGASRSVSITNSSTAVGTLPTSATIAAGSDNVVVQYTPKAQGTATLGVTQPTGYTAPARYTTLPVRVDPAPTQEP
jgi:hypothetical protein